MKNFYFFLIILPYIVISQTIAVDNSSHSSSDLVELLLGNSCTEVSNVSISSTESVAYFNQNGSSFPIEEGIVIRSGEVLQTQGIYTDTNLSTQVNSQTDIDLEQISQSNGQTASVTDIAFLEFDFVPISTNFNFDFLFASNEYGQWQCGFSDVFAFLLTDLNTGLTTNLAVIPGSSTPVSVKDIRDDAYNSSCQSVNASLFSVYNVNNPANSTLNMRGHTVVLNASSAVIPNNPYKIRLVIGDYNDSTFDSAVFLASGSFSTSIDLGEDDTLCDGDFREIATGLDEQEFEHSWFLNGEEIPNETTSTLTVTQTGVYQVIASKPNSNCLIVEEITFTDLMVNPAVDLYVCENNSGVYVYDLTINDLNQLGLDPQVYELIYYASESDLQNDLPITPSELTEYQSLSNQTIYIKLLNVQTNQICLAQYSFDLLVNPAFEIQQPQEISVCGQDWTNIVDLTQNNQIILNGLNSSDYTITFYQDQNDAINSENQIGTSFSLAVGTTNATIWIRVEDVNFSDCFQITSFDINSYPLPLVDTHPDVLECSDYILPELTNGNYFTEPNGQGDVLFAGDGISENGTYYIFNGPDQNGCVNQTSFTAVFIESYLVQENHCGEFIVPTPPAGNFFTESGGPNSNGIELLPGTVLTQSQTIYYYAELEGEFCRDDPMPITIIPLPEVDELEDIITCNSYTLEPLLNGNYFTNSGGTGTALFAGDQIMETTTIYIYSENEECVNESEFVVTIVGPFENIIACGSYELPILEEGNYYTEPSGQGQQIEGGTVITQSTQVFVHAQTSFYPNCTDNVSFNITIFPIPQVDELEDVVLCQNTPYVLPELVNGQYFTQPNRGGVELFSGDYIEQSQTVYINNTENNCSNESNFFVEIKLFPPIVNFTDVFSCDPYVLPQISDGRYYTEPFGVGQELPAGHVIEQTQTIYIYNSWEDLPTCYSQNQFTINILGVDVGDFEDVNVCDSYTLPALDVGNYYSEPNGGGQVYSAGELFTESTRIYVYADNGDRFVCEDEESFQITISTTPVLPEFEDREACGLYELEQLFPGDYQIGYYWDVAAEHQISNLIIDQEGVHTIYVRAHANENEGCYDQKSFYLTIHPLLDLPIEGGTICKDQYGNIIELPLIESHLDPSEFEVQWFLMDELLYQGPNFYPSQVGEYRVETIKLSPEVGDQCNYNPTMFTVSESSLADASVVVKEAFVDQSTVEVYVNGEGNYEFKLDYHPYQSSNIFENVSSGMHRIYVRDVNLCGEISLEVYIINYPKFFTPNDDGHNDTWNIWDLSLQEEAVISIFDRHGMLIKQLSPNDKLGWDGTNEQGSDLPSSDYWFEVNYTLNDQSKVFKSHFTLKR